MCPSPRWVLCLSLFSALLFLTRAKSSSWPQDGCRPGERAEERDRMVREQIQARGVEDPSVLEAMRKVPRHCFVPSAFEPEAYEDHPIAIGPGQTISQPYIVALMTELLRLKKTDRVLEIGTGSGYQAAVLSDLANEVFTLEIDPLLANKAAERLKSLGYKNVVVRCGDGSLGWTARAPFDAILVTAASSRIPPPLLEQLKPEGRMCIPVGGRDQVQQLMLVDKSHDGSVSVRPVAAVRFVPLLEGRGEP